MVHFERSVTNDFGRDLVAIQQIDVVPRILEVVCRTTGMGFAAVARVPDDRWIACAVRDQIAFGLQPGGELDLKTTICDEIRQSKQLVAIDHVAADPHFCVHQTPKMYGFQSYISVPLCRPDGSFFGTLCAIDPNPARVDNVETIGMFTLFADLIGYHLAAQDQLIDKERALLESRDDVDLRERFIAVLGHDLRNPLAAIDAGGRALDLMAIPEPAHRMVALINRSSVRMAELINGLVDFARGKLGGGFTLEAEDVSDLGSLIDHVVAEHVAASGDRRIAVDVLLMQPVRCDRARMAQVISNLVGNAVTHGDPKSPVVVRARIDADTFELMVENGGAPIPQAQLPQLFQPFVRGRAPSDQAGLGLGLYIASEIARAHGGTLDAMSDTNATRFTLRVPITRVAAA